MADDIGGIKMPNAASNPASQVQEQSQQQSIQISVNSAGDVDFERRVFRDLYSVGRQLSRLSGVVELLVARSQMGQGAQLSPAEQKALSDFQEMRDVIGRQLSERDERPVEALEKLRAENPERFAALVPRLQQLLGQG